MKTSRRRPPDYVRFSYFHKSFLTTMRIFTFPKAEHLCLRNDIEQLFASGSKSAAAYPLRLVYRIVDHQAGPQVKVLLSVPKRKLRHAVDRNRAKRQLREAYRKHKHSLLAALPHGVGLHIGFLWLSDKPIESSLVEKKVVQLLTRLEENMQASTTTTPESSCAPTQS